MSILSYADLASRAGVDPWALHAKVAVGDPAQVETLATAFYKASGDMADARSSKATADRYVAEGYTVAGSSPVDFAGQAAATHASPEHLQSIAKILQGVAGELDSTMSTAASEVSSLESQLNAIEGEWSSFMRTIGHHLPPEDQQAERDGLLNAAVSAVKTHGATINDAITKYEENVYGAQRSVADLGYVPPATVDDLYGDGAAYVAGLQADARAAADKLKNNHTIDGKWATDTHDIALSVKKYMNDPYFASAFYGELGPQETQMLPSLFYASGSKTTRDDLATFSHMFGTAVTNAQDDPNMTTVANSFLNTPRDPGTAWNRGAMASNGNFPSDWLAKAARYNALDTFAEHGAEGYGMGWQGTPNGPFAYDAGLPDNALALWTQDLGHNPLAAREALATMGNGDASNITMPSDPSSAYQTNIHKLIEYGHQEDYPGDVAAAYGKAFAAAAGATNEVDGAHSAAAVTFTKALFNDLHSDNGIVEPNAATSMAQIGASYVQELAAGNDQEGTSVVAVDANGRVAGDNAAFGVPPELAKEFMKTFVGQQDATTIFDQAAGAAAHHAMLAGAQQDTNLLAHGQSAYGFNTAAQAYGSVAGSENGAGIQVVGQEVEDAKHAQETMKSILSLGVDMIPAGKLAEDAGGVFARMSDSVWDAMKHGTNMGLETVYGAEPGSQAQLDHLNDASYQTAIVGDYERTSVLREAGYPGIDRIPPDLLIQDGQMVNVATVMNDPHLRETYYEYMHSEANAPQGSLGHGASVYEITKNAAGRFENAYVQARGNSEGKSE